MTTSPSSGSRTSKSAAHAPCFAAALASLAERGYAVRHLPGQGLPQGLRITIGTAAQMDEVATALREMAEAAR